MEAPNLCSGVSDFDLLTLIVKKKCDSGKGVRIFTSFEIVAGENKDMLPVNCMYVFHKVLNAVAVKS